MGITKVDIRVCRIDRPERGMLVKGVGVDTGATVSAIPIDVVRELGIKLPDKRRFLLATGRSVQRQVGYALIEFEGRRTSDDIIAIKSGPPLLGVRALEGMGLEVDPRTGRVKKLEGALLI